ncbi:MAG: HAD-IIA family hydrolase [Planctomycetia bacterium]|nr:HAD-IIA family hydrolase [Planctomycetia bacterium]
MNPCFFHSPDSACLSPFGEEELLARLRKIRHVALDMDGTIYLGSSIFPFTLEFLDRLKRLGISYSFLTNNPSRSMDDYLAKLAKIGIPATRDEMHTTAVAMVDFLTSQHPEYKRLFLMGTPSMVAQFEQAGFERTAMDTDDEPDAVVVAFDLTLTYEKLCAAAWWIAQGKPFFATNPDQTCPTDKKTILVDCGSICACLTSATGRKPDRMLGKPDPEMLYGLMEKRNLKPDEVAMVGDRLYTDVETAHNAGAFGVLVLTGETTLETAYAAPKSPHLTVQNIEKLGELLEESKK